MVLAAVWMPSASAVLNTGILPEKAIVQCPAVIVPEVRDYTPGETIIERGSDHQMMFIVRALHTPTARALLEGVRNRIAVLYNDKTLNILLLPPYFVPFASCHGYRCS